MTRSLLVVLALVACGKSDKKPAADKVIAPRALEGMAFELPDQWTSTYDKDSDAWQIASADAQTKVRIERADERYVASPDAYMHHVSAKWSGKLVTIEERKNVKGGFAMTLGIFAGEKDPNPQRATVVVRELGSRWYRCLSEGADSEGIRADVLALCRSVKLAEPGVPLTDFQLVDRWFAAMEKQLAADAQQAATQKFASREEAEQALMALTPAGFKPRPEFFQALYDEAGMAPAVLAQRFASYASAHGDDMERRATAMLEHLNAQIEQATANVQRQFPPAR